MHEFEQSEPETGIDSDDGVFGSLRSRYLCGVARSNQHFQSQRVRESLSGAKPRTPCWWHRDSGIAAEWRNPAFPDLSSIADFPVAASLPCAQGIEARQRP